MTALAGTHVIGSEAFWGHISDKANGILEAEYFDHTPISVRYAQEVIRAVGSSVAEHKRLLKHIQK
jgi:hypothetical protein